MADYVRRGKVEFELCGGNLPEKYKAFVRRVLNDKNLVPAADVAEVVRCQYCKNFRRNEENDPYCADRRGLSDPEPDGYCSYGDRREGGNDHVSD